MRYRGAVQYRGDIMSTVGDILSTVGGGQYHGGYHEYRGELSFLFEYPLYWTPPTVLMISPTCIMISPTVLKLQRMVSPTVLNTPTVLMISPTCIMISRTILIIPTVLKVTPRYSWYPPRYWTPPRYSRYPHIYHDIPAVLNTPRYSRYLPTVLKISPHSTQDISPQYSWFPSRYWTPPTVQHTAHTLCRWFRGTNLRLLKWKPNLKVSLFCQLSNHVFFLCVALYLKEECWETQGQMSLYKF